MPGHDNPHPLSAARLFDLVDRVAQVTGAAQAGSTPTRPIMPAKARW